MDVALSAAGPVAHNVYERKLVTLTPKARDILQVSAAPESDRKLTKCVGGPLLQSSGFYRFFLLQSKVLHLPLSQLLRTCAHSTIRWLASVAL